MRRPANYRKIEAHHFSTYLINHSWCTECPPPGTYRRVANCKVLIIYNLSKRPATLWQSSKIISSCLQQHDNFLDQLNCNCKMSQIANFFLFSGLSDLILWNLNCNLQDEMWLVWRERLATMVYVCKIYAMLLVSIQQDLSLHKNRFVQKVACLPGCLETKSHFLNPVQWCDSREEKWKTLFCSLHHTRTVTKYENNLFKWEGKWPFLKIIIKLHQSWKQNVWFSVVFSRLLHSYRH